MPHSARSQIITTRPEAGEAPSGGAIGYSSVGKGVNPYDLSFPIAEGQLAIVTYMGSDWTNAPYPAVSGDDTHHCFVMDIPPEASDDPDPDRRRYTGGGWVTGDGMVTLSLDAMTGGNSGYINVIVVEHGSHECRTGS